MNGVSDESFMAQMSAAGWNPAIASSDWRYGDVMKPLDLNLFDGSSRVLYDSDPLFREWFHAEDSTRRSEKICGGVFFTPELVAAYEIGSEEFSRLRGYSEQEISDFMHRCQLTDRMIERYGLDEVCGFSFENGLLTVTPEMIEMEARMSVLTLELTGWMPLDGGGLVGSVGGPDPAGYEFEQEFFSALNPGLSTIPKTP